MDDDTLNQLQEALALSPDNAPLRRQIAKAMIRKGRHAEAEAMLRAGIAQGSGARLLEPALAEAFALQGKVSEALVILEQHANRSDVTGETLMLLCRTLLRNGDHDRARTAYRRAIDLDDKLANDDLADELGVDDTPDTPFGADDDVDELGRVRQSNQPHSASLPIEMEKPGVDFSHVGGMDAVKDDIRVKIIEPIQHADMYKAYGKAVGGGILMYGPPGCGKTHIARATAGEVDAGFIAVGLHDVLDMYLGQSEQKLHALFDYARQHTPCVLFFDEVDAIAAKRSDMQGSAGRQVINQFLAELDGVRESNDGLLILAATNAPWHLDSAFRRPGRFDRILFVPPPDTAGAAAILRVLLQGKPQESIDTDAVARKCAGFSGADLKAVVDLAVEDKLREAVKTGTPKPLVTKDLQRAAKKVKPSTKEWFATARNHALYSNEGGAYDDVLNYLKMR